MASIFKKVALSAIIASLGLTLAACSTTDQVKQASTPVQQVAKSADGKPTRYVVVHINDTHGHFWEDKNGVGGLAYVKTIINKVRDDNKARGVPTLVLHSGDWNTGVPESDVLKAVPDLIAINDIGFDAVVIGNHEFDMEYSEMMKQRDFLKVPVLSANIYYNNPKTNKKEHPYKSYEFVNKDGLNFLIVGTTTTSTKYQANPIYTKNFDFTDPKQEFDKAVADSTTKNGKADAVISLSHLGLYINADHGDLPYGDWTLAQKNAPGSVAAYVTGHTHIFGCVDKDGKYAYYKVGDTCNVPIVNGAPLIQANKWGYYVGVAEFEIKDGVSTMVNYELIPVNQKVRKKDAQGNSYYEPLGPQVAADKELYDKLKVYQEEGNKLLLVKAAELKGGDLVATRAANTKIGTFLANAYRQIANADVGILNSGGIRDNFRQGNISYRDILIVNPFGNTITTVELTGKELYDYIQTIVLYDGGAFPQYGGVTFTYDYKVGKITDVKVGGKALDMNKKYKLAVLSFQAAGGDRYPKITDKKSYVDLGYTDAKSLFEFMKKLNVIDVSKLKIEGPTFLNKPAEKPNENGQPKQYN